MSVYTVSADFCDIKIDKKQVLRLMGCPENDEVALEQLDGVLAPLAKAVKYRACYSVFDITIDRPIIRAGFADLISEDLCTNLSGCASAVVFAATAGIELDRLIQRYSALSPLKAVIADAAGSAAIEAFCDKLNEDFAHRFGSLKPRYSPGYGDLDICCQPAILDALEGTKRLGLTLNENNMMIPTKSVTAIIGIKRG